MRKSTIVTTVLVVLLTAAALSASMVLAQDGQPTQEATEEAIQESVLTPTVETMGEGIKPDATLFPGGGLTYLRLAHFSPDAPSVEVYVDGQISDIQTLNFGNVTGWIELPAASYQIVLAPAGTSLDEAVLGPAAFTLAPDTWNTVAVVGSSADRTLTTRMLTERYTYIPAQNAHVTVFHAIEGAPAVDVLAADGSVLVSNLAYGSGMTVDVPAGSYDLRVVATGTTDPALLTLESTTLDAATFYFIAAVGTPDAPQAVLDAVAESVLSELSDGFMQTGNAVEMQATAEPTEQATVEAVG